MDKTTAPTQKHAHTGILALCILLLGVCSTSGADSTPFLVDDSGKPHPDATQIAAWHIVATDPAYGGQWVVAGDLDGDGSVKIVSAENFNENDVHYTSAVVALKLDGQVLWKWGNPDIGRKTWHHDVACQMHDWDEDGHDEIMAVRGLRMG